jgi:hypothetical protein
MTFEQGLEGAKLLVTLLTPLLLALIAARQNRAAKKVETVRQDLAQANGGVQAKLAALHEEIGGLKQQLKTKKDPYEQ